MIGSPFVTFSAVALNNMRSRTDVLGSSAATLQLASSLKITTFSSSNEMICSSFFLRSSGMRRVECQTSATQQNWMQFFFFLQWSPRISFALLSCCLLSSSVSLGGPSSSSLSLSTQSYLKSSWTRNLGNCPPNYTTDDLFLCLFTALLSTR